MAVLQVLQVITQNIAECKSEGNSEDHMSVGFILRGPVNVWTKFQGNPSSICWEISFWTRDA